MVHKKYITIKGKRYGPYYYKSYRDKSGKVKKRYIKRPDRGMKSDERKFWGTKRINDGQFLRRDIVVGSVMVFFVFLALTYFITPQETIEELFSGVQVLFAPPGASSGTNGVDTLETWDDTDTGDYFSGDSVGFYAELTSGGGFIGDGDGGSCQIRYNYDGTFTAFTAMVYNAVDTRWEATNVFDHITRFDRPALVFEVECDYQGRAVNVPDNEFVIMNTDPVYDPSAIRNYFGDEDVAIEIDISAFVIDPDVNDVLGFLINDVDGPKFGPVSGSEVSMYSWISIDPLTGILLFNATLDDEGTQGEVVHDVNVFVFDLSGDGVSDGFTFDVTPRNDPPYFVNLVNESFNATFPFVRSYEVVDEELDYPLVFSPIEFLPDCSFAVWSTRTDCNLIGAGSYTLDSVLNMINIDNFTPFRNDVGHYFANFTVVDSRGALGESVVNYTILNINEGPVFIDLCVDGVSGLDLRSVTEDAVFGCDVSARDPDESIGLTFSANESWFSFSGGGFVPWTGTVDEEITSVVGFTPGDAEVGVWNLNISALDEGSPALTSSEVIQFTVNNVNDQPDLLAISDVSTYTSLNEKRILVQVEDNDLLIPGPEVYQEIFGFVTGNGCLSVVDLGQVGNSNISEAEIVINPGCLGAGVHSMDLTVNDNSGLSDVESFDITVQLNEAPVWRVANPEFDMTEDSVDYNLVGDSSGTAPLNLNSDLVNDADGDEINFVYYLEDGSPFDGFDLDGTTGVISFVGGAPSDEDIGVHVLVINATDVNSGNGEIKSEVSNRFSFTIQNVNDLPVMSLPITASGVVGSPGVNSNITVEEDSFVTLQLRLDDDDLNIPLEQIGFFEEILDVSTTVIGVNDTLVEFIEKERYDDLFEPDDVLFEANFTPVKSDLEDCSGSPCAFTDYDITVDIMDLAGETQSLNFIMTIVEVSHYPEFEDLMNLSGAVGFRFEYDINSSDIEDGNESLGDTSFIYGYEMLDGDLDILAGGGFNTALGNITKDFVSGDEGIYHINFSVADSSGRVTYEDYFLHVYGYPTITSPLGAFTFQMTEGVEDSFDFSATHVVGNDLNYEFYLQNRSLGVFLSPGDGSVFAWNFIPSYNDETYGGVGEFEVVVSPVGLPGVNASMTWRAIVQHMNAPFRFNESNEIGDKETSAGSAILIDLKEHFTDEDAFDTNCNQNPDCNQIVEFFVTSQDEASAIDWEIDYSTWVLSLTSGEIVTEILNVSGTDFTVSALNYSNYFEIKFTDPQVVEVPVPVSGGGSSGSDTRERPIPLRIIVPGTVFAREGDIVEIPLTLENTGPIDLEGVDLGALLYKEQILRSDLSISLSRERFDVLSSGQSEDVILTVQLAEDEYGLYEINIDAESEDPSYTDSGKIVIYVEEGESIVERLVFTEELIAENPECAEIQEILDESREFLDLGQVDAAEEKLTEALNGCRDAISQQSFFSGRNVREKLQDRAFISLLVGTIIALLLGIGYYTYRTITFRRALKASVGKDLNTVNSGEVKSFK